VARTGRRRWPAATLAVLVAAGAAAAFVLLWLSAGERRAVIVVARPVPAGQRVAAEDLTQARVAADPQVEVIAAGDASEVVGQTARTDLVAGELLSRGELGGDGGLAAGEALAGLALEPGRLPAGNVEVGDRVQVLDTGASEQAGQAGGSAPGWSLLAEGRVVSVAEDTQTGTGQVAVTVVTDTASAAAVAAAEAAGRASLLVIGS
jgi:hypothetical protein